MKLPKQISPDKIKNAVVEFRYTSTIPFQVLIGYIYKALDDSYNYTAQPIQSQKVAQQLNLGLPAEITFNLGNLNLFFTDSIKFELRPNSIIFNCLSRYIGWSKYFEDISKVLQQISSIQEIEVFTRIGMRYISEYLSTNIKEVTKFDFSFGIPSVVSETFAFRSEFMLDRFKVNLNLQSNTPTIKSIPTNNIPEVLSVSLIDIDIIAEHLTISNVDELLVLLDTVHNKEKEVFFNLLKSEYLETLNPIY